MSAANGIITFLLCPLPDSSEMSQWERAMGENLNFARMWADWSTSMQCLFVSINYHFFRCIFFIFPAATAAARCRYYQYVCSLSSRTIITRFFYIHVLGLMNQTWRSKLKQFVDGAKGGRERREKRKYESEIFLFSALCVSSSQKEKRASGASERWGKN